MTMLLLSREKVLSGAVHHGMFLERALAPASLAIAHRARRLAVEMIHRGGEGHFGGSLSMIDLLSVLHADLLDRGAGDRFILSKGHGAAGLYAVLAACGNIDPVQLERFGRAGSALQGHPDMTTTDSIDFSTGSLGQGLSAALGMALILRDKASVADTGGRAWVVLGDGECQEGQVWEAAMLAERLCAGRLTAVIDANGYQEYGFRDAGNDPVINLAAKWAAFGWLVTTTDGHDHAALADALRTAAAVRNRPTVVIARTIKGYGVDLIAAQPDRFHCGALTKAEYAEALKQLA